MSSEKELFEKKKEQNYFKSEAEEEKWKNWTKVDYCRYCHHFLVDGPCCNCHAGALEFVYETVIKPDIDKLVVALKNTVDAIEKK